MSIFEVDREPRSLSNVLDSYVALISDLVDSYSAKQAAVVFYKLSGFKGNRTWECHIEPNWLLVWEQNDMRLTLLMLDTGTHADLFR